ncbi:hypothetical protein [Streptococcus mitis]|uniref:hypothetical protein n=1 Tax=Streptococcus mitis TaxID=28037 RepID=UPI0039C3D45F
MGVFELNNQPQSPYITIQTEKEVSREQFLELLGTKTDINLAIRFINGPQTRGGYLFSFTKESEDDYILKSIDGEKIATFNLEFLIRYINHASGLKFDPDILDCCQKVINLKND